MWSSEHTPVLSAPVSVVTSPVDRPWGHFSCRQSPAAMIGVPAGCRVETILKERLPEPQRHQSQVQQSRPTARSKKRAIFGRLRDMLSRSRSSSKGAAKCRGVRPSSLDASATVRRPATDSSMYKSAPVSVRRQHATATAATEDRAGGGGGQGDKPKTPTERGGREENFHAAMDNKLVHVAFAAFCKRTLSSENVEFVGQVRELEQLSASESATTSELCEKLRSVGDEFVSPDSDTEVNVKGSTREDVLCSIQAALEAAGYSSSADGDDVDRDGDYGYDGVGEESPWARVLTIAATEALVGLARQVHTVIFDGIWPRFLASDEFAVLMKSEEMRTTGFKDLDGKVIVSALPPQHPGAGGSGGGGGAAGRGKPSVSHKRQLSSRLAASFRARGAGRGGGVGQDGEEEMEATTAAATPTRGGADSTSPKKDSLSRKTSPATARSLSMTSGLSSNGSGSGLSSGPSFDTAETSSGEGSTFSTGSAKPPLGRRSLGRPTPVSSSSSRPPRTVHQPCGGSSTDTCQLKQQQQHNHHHHQHSLGAFSARWAGASRARKTAGGGAMAGGCKNGLGSSPASPVKGRMCNGSRSATPFSAAATSRRAFSLR